MELHSNNQRSLYTREGKSALICWNEQTKTVQSEGENPIDVTMYTYDYVRVSFPFTYESLVAAIVRSKYNEDAMQAVVNNYLLNPEDADHKSEFDTMQLWRQEAKTIAKQAVEAEQANKTK